MKASTWMSLMLLGSGCVGTDVGNPPGDDARRSTLEFVAVDGDVTGASALSADSPRAEVAWLSIESVRVQPDCNGTPVLIEGPFYAELVSGEVRPAPVVVEGAFDEVCRLRVDLGPAANDAPAELVGLSLLVIGTGEDGAVTIESDTERVLPYLGDAFEIGDDLRFIDAFDSSGWFARSGTGEGAASAFLNALKQDSRIVRDADDDGLVSRGEYIDPVASPAP